MSTNPSILIQEKIDAIDRRWRWITFWEYFFAAASAFTLVWFMAEVCACRAC